MQYLILKHTPYEYINDSYDIVSATDNFDEATNKVQGYRMINEDKSVSFSILRTSLFEVNLKLNFSFNLLFLTINLYGTLKILFLEI